MSLADSIAKDRAQPATVRIGIVTAVAPLLITTQGTPFQRVGVIAGYIPALGDVVAMLGQSAVSADGSSWLALGRIVTNDSGMVTASTQSSLVDPAGVSTTSLTYVPLTGTFNPGVVFQAPASGRVLVHIRSSFAAAVGQTAWTSARIGTGNVVGAGTLVLAATDNNAVMSPGSMDAGATFSVFTGLTPGTTYNAEMQHRTTGGTSFWARRQIIVEPVP